MPCDFAMAHTLLRGLCNNADAHMGGSQVSSAFKGEQNMRVLTLLAVVGMLGASAVACSKKSDEPASGVSSGGDVGDKVEEAAEDTGDKIEEATE